MNSSPPGHSKTSDLMMNSSSPSQSKTQNLMISTQSIFNDLTKTFLSHLLLNAPHLKLP